MLSLSQGAQKSLDAGSVNDGNKGHWLVGRDGERAHSGERQWSFRHVW